MILGLLFLFLLVSPTLIVLWAAIAHLGLIWSLLFIPIGAIVGAVLLGICGGCLYELTIRLEDRRTGSPPAASIGAATGRAIVELIIMALGGWIGTGLEAWLVARFWLGVI